MPIQSQDTTTLGPWPVGINNRQPDYAMPATEDGRQIALRDCVNVDLDNTGRARRRAGFTKVAGALNARGGFSCAAGTFFVDGQHLMRLNSDNSVTNLGGPIRGAQVSYAYANGVLYLSDGLVCKRVVNGALGDWGIEVPAAPLMAQAASPGGFVAGRYLAAVTYLRADGQEGGSSLATEIELTDNAGVNFAALPLAASAEITHLRLYLSRPNGSLLYHVSTVANGTVSATLLVDDGGIGKPLETRHLSPPPPGRIVREFNGRTLVANGPVLWMSEAFALERFNYATGYVQYLEDVTIVEPVADGVWVVADQTYFLRGIGTAEFSQVARLAHGAIFGTGCEAPGTKNKAWHTPRGMVMASAGGEIKNMTEDNVAMGDAVSGATIIREHDGLRLFTVGLEGFVASSLKAAQVVAAPPSSSALSGATASDFFTATVIP